MNNFEENKRYIDKMLKIAISEGKFDKFLICYPGFCIETRDQNGFRNPNLMFTMNAIYDYYRKNPNSHIDKLTYDTLIKIIKTYHSDLMVDTVINIVSFQLLYEKENNAPFKIDCQSILSSLREVILANKEKFVKDNNEWIRGSFWKEIEHYDHDLNQRFNHKLL